MMKMNNLMIFDREDKTKEPTVSARELYRALDVSKNTRFSRWFETNAKQLIEGEDFQVCLQARPHNQTMELFNRYKTIH